MSRRKKHNQKKKEEVKKTNNQVNKQEKKNIENEISTESKPKKIKVIWLWILTIVAATFIAYSPIFQNDFTNWDDKGYVLENNVAKQGISWQTVTDAFWNKKYQMGNYHPLAMFSLAVDYEIGQTKFAKNLSKSITGKEFVYEKEEADTVPLPFVFTNLFLHILSTIILFWLIYELLSSYDNKKRFFAAFITSLLFGVNAIHVESVVWISERKDVLYTFFFMASLLCYLKYLTKKKVYLYVLSIFLFILSLLSKGQAVSLAVTLVAIDFFKGRKLLNIRVILEKVPFFILAAIFGVIAIFAQKSGSAIHDINEFNIIYRFVFAAYGLTMYIVKAIVPYDLAAIYPYPIFINNHPPFWFWFFIIPALGLVGTLVWALIKNKKDISFGLLFYFLNIFLLLQFIPVGSAIMADRYAYIPSIGFLFLIAVIYNRLAVNKGLEKILFVGIIGLSIFWISKTYAQTKIWSNSIKLWSNTVRVSPHAPVAWNNKGSAMSKNEQKIEAINDYSNAISIKDDYYHAYYNRGTARKDVAVDAKDIKIKQKFFLEAIADFDTAIVINPDFTEAYYNKGVTLDNMNQLDSAMKNYNIALEKNPKHADAYVNRGVVKGKMGDFDGAIADFKHSLTLKPNSASAYSNLGLAHDHTKEYDKAIEFYSISISLNPKNAETYMNRAFSYAHKKDYNSAIADCSRTIKRDQNHVRAYYYRAFYYLKTNENEKACADFNHAGILGYKPAIQAYNQNCVKK